MGSEQVAEHFHITKNEEKIDYAKMIEDACPYYMAAGMTYKEYWEGDNDAPKYYRKMAREKAKQTNHDLWLQGMYVYEAILDASPVYRPFTKNPKPLPYPNKPYEIFEIEKKEKEQKQAKKDMEVQDKFRAWVDRFNSKRAKKNG